MRFSVGVLTLILAGLSSSPVWAFSLRDHLAITDQAIEEYNSCFPGAPVGKLTEAAVVTADLEEDLNLFKKWIAFSHFYNPLHPIKMTYRLDASAGLRLAEAQLQNPLVSNEEALGHALHLIQDMASPPHVVPVMHNLTDRFEDFSTTSAAWGVRWRDSQSRDATCAIFRQPKAASLFDIFKETSLTTLENLKREVLVERAGIPLHLSIGELYWHGNDDGTFGSYGLAGNHFGEEDFNQGYEPMHVNLETSLDVFDQQLRLAVEATKRALFLQYQGR